MIASFISFIQTIMEEKKERIELAGHKILFQKGEFYHHFYQLIEGVAEVQVGNSSLQIGPPTILGDYQLLQGIQYRLSTVRTVTKCVFKVYDVASYANIKLFQTEFDRAFEKYRFHSRALKYWLKKLFKIINGKKGERVGNTQTLGVILDGQFRIDKNIPIVQMKAKNMQLLKKFQICLVGVGELFKGFLVVDSSLGVVGVCQPKHIDWLHKKFDEFRPVVDFANFKTGVHEDMEEGIKSQCKKRPRLYQHMVPLPLKEHVKTEGMETERKEVVVSLEGMSVRVPRVSQNVFALEHNITQFLHKQIRRGLSLTIKRKQVSPLGMKKSPRSKGKVRKDKLDIESPILINLQKFKDLKRKQLREEKNQRTIVKVRQPLPILNPVRIKTQGNESAPLKRYLKILNFD